MSLSGRSSGLSLLLFIAFMLLSFQACRKSHAQQLQPGDTHAMRDDSANAGARRIAFTFDDGDTSDYAPYPLEDWNQRLLNALSRHQLKAILFSSGKNKSNPKGRYILESWDSAGQGIANHSFYHRNYHDPTMTAVRFREDLLRNDSLIRGYAHFLAMFRFPYLKEGDTREKADSARAILSESGYRNGHVSVDASDWYLNARMIQRMKRSPGSDLSAYRDYYLNHIYERAMFYDSLAFEMEGRRISHVLLLHHNLLAALYLDDLIGFFQQKGWEVINAQEAYQDPIYSKSVSRIPAGESLIWSRAKESGRFEGVLRYPAEDAEYEKPGMDKLGL